MTGTKGWDLLFIRGFKVPLGKKIKSDSDGRRRMFEKDKYFQERERE